MRAWIKGADGLVLGQVDPPRQAADELLLDVRAVSLNRGEIRTAARAAAGVVPGWDVAGVVAAAAPNGEGPAPGTRVAALVDRGGWAERVSVPAARAAVVPDGLELEVAATLPTAGLTVMRAFDFAGSLLGKRLLVTGGAGGVGQLAIQLGARAGATVTAITSRAGLHAELRALGAHQVVGAIEAAAGAFDLVLESVGGASLAAAIERVAHRGVIVTIGNSSERETSFNARVLYGKGGATIYGLLIFDEVASRRVGARELERLMAFTAAGELRSSIALRRSWTALPTALAELERRVFAGKAVLTVD